MNKALRSQNGSIAYILLAAVLAVFVAFIGWRGITNSRTTESSSTSGQNEAKAAKLVEIDKTKLPASWHVVNDTDTVTTLSFEDASGQQSCFAEAQVVDSKAKSPVIDYVQEYKANKSKGYTYSSPSEGLGFVDLELHRDGALKQTTFYPVYVSFEDKEVMAANLTALEVGYSSKVIRVNHTCNDRNDLQTTLPALQAFKFTTVRQ